MKGTCVLSRKNEICIRGALYNNLTNDRATVSSTVINLFNVCRDGKQLIVIILSQKDIEPVGGPTD